MPRSFWRPACSFRWGLNGDGRFEMGLESEGVVRFMVGGGLSFYGEQIG